MNIEELAPLMNGLSVETGAHMLVCERAMITRLKGDAVDMAFWIAGTGHRPRLRLTHERLLRSTPKDLARIVSRVVVSAVTGERRG
jgi:hypothetical protein